MTREATGVTSDLQGHRRRGYYLANGTFVGRGVLEHPPKYAPACTSILPIAIYCTVSCNYGAFDEHVTCPHEYLLASTTIHFRTPLRIILATSLRLYRYSMLFVALTLTLVSFQYMLQIWYLKPFIEVVANSCMLLHIMQKNTSC